ncbi:MAG: RdgB/HAM1 family non-canonical purine NTP pyrophosphatase [Sphingobacteriales bacterium]|nr:MAG: RdgB/HAM1 family non-canonical purine NTP pyrophosphatase [Sphingobacteriales bacterium]TAF83149.1 MAG: RdgB/HAM1 family non-canonical purine NTP pyrophosphatase [Sphingobacteriales bacterium]
MITLVFATNNPNKQQEVQAKVGAAFKILSLADINCTHDIAETGLTLDENASIKSRYIFDNYQLNCFGDDTGLEIEALDNQPGVYSARYSGTRDSEKNIDLVLQKLAHSSNRNARFRTVISLIINSKEYIFEGIVNGTIRHQRSGTGGFGYDAIFEPNGYGITFAEMVLKEKNKISHRGLALQKLITFLRQL